MVDEPDLIIKYDAISWPITPSGRVVAPASPALIAGVAQSG